MRLIRPFVRLIPMLAFLTLTGSAVTGCGTDFLLLGASLSGKSSECIEDLRDDLDDAEDSEDVGEALDDFDDCD